MKIYTVEELKEILVSHKLWLTGNKGFRADLSGADLIGADLSGADLSGADLIGANLSKADLREANLSGADLREANLIGAYLIGADLSKANLIGANLSGADLSGANLIGADLIGANLGGANLSGANLREANLSRANLIGADLREADLNKEQWHELKDKFSIVTPDTKYVFKKLSDNVIAHLEVPKKAKRSNAFSRKCRASKVKVIKLVDSDGKNIKEAFSCYDRSFKYTVGKIVKPILPFDDNWYNECGSGIHFFLTESEAKEFNL